MGPGSHFTDPKKVNPAPFINALRWSDPEAAGRSGAAVPAKVDMLGALHAWVIK